MPNISLKHTAEHLYFNKKNTLEAYNLYYTYNSIYYTADPTVDTTTIPFRRFGRSPTA